MSATNQQRAEEWFNRADHDLLVAESSLRAPRIAAGVVCHLCQQCAEKYLKGFLTSHTTPFRRTHDLTALLLTRVSLDGALNAVQYAANALTVYAFAGRYPDVPGQFPTVIRAQQTLAHPRAIRTAVRASLKLA